MIEESPALEPLFPDRDSAEPLGRQFTRRLRAAIEVGFYPAASRLLPRRELAFRLGLSRNTINAAIEQLIAEGYLESRVGSGTYVAAPMLKEDRIHDTPARDLPLAAQRIAAACAELEPGTWTGPLRTGIPDLTFFPHTTWARLSRRTMNDLGSYLDLDKTNGEVALREAIVQHVAQFRGVTARRERVIIVEGTQAAIRLVADALLSQGDAVVVEDPCYFLARAALEAFAYRLVPVPVDDEGIDIARAPAAARLALVAPSHQYPLGSRMSLERRRALLRWAQSNDAYILEDDYDSEYTYDGKPLPALQSIDTDERVIYVGTFSKTLAPALRVGYLIVPDYLVDTFTSARALSTLGGNRYVQATLAEFLSGGHYARYVHQMRLRYRERRDSVLALLQAGLPPEFHIGRADGGLQVAIIGPPALDDVGIAQAMLRDGVFVQPLSPLCIARTDLRGFVLGYSAEPLPETLIATRAFLSGLRARLPSRPE